MDAARLRYRGVRNRYQSLTGTPSSIVHWAGGDHAWDTILQFLAATDCMFENG
jgi:hypothetical protein